MMHNKHIPQWKIDEIDTLYELFNQFKNVAVISVGKIGDRQIQAVRKVLRGDAVIKMAKKSLQQRAIERYKKETDKENLDELLENITGQSSLVFTDLDVIELKNVFKENLWMIAAKPDEETPVDIWVLAGDTGLPTGQVISELNMVLKLPTRIQNDTIWIREDTCTHKAGQYVNVKEAAALKKLGVKPVESLIKIQYGWQDGMSLPKDVIYMDMEQFQEDVAACFSTARALAIGMGVIDDITIAPLIQKGHREALALLFELPIFDERMTEEYLKKAVINANVINAVINDNND